MDFMFGGKGKQSGIANHANEWLQLITKAVNKNTNLDLIFQRESKTKQKIRLVVILTVKRKVTNHSLNRNSFDSFVRMHQPVSLSLRQTEEKKNCFDTIHSIFALLHLGSTACEFFFLNRRFNPRMTPPCLLAKVNLLFEDISVWAIQLLENLMWSPGSPCRKSLQSFTKPIITLIKCSQLPKDESCVSFEEQFWQIFPPEFSEDRETAFVFTWKQWHFQGEDAADLFPKKEDWTLLRTSTDPQPDCNVLEEETQNWHWLPGGWSFLVFWNFLVSFG